MLISNASEIASLASDLRNKISNEELLPQEELEEILAKTLEGLEAFAKFVQQLDEAVQTHASLGWLGKYGA